jgi:hypothetical protein
MKSKIYRHLFEGSSILIVILNNHFLFFKMLETVPQSGIYELLSPDSMKEPALVSLPQKRKVAS